MIFIHLRFALAFLLFSLLACQPSTPMMDTDLSSLVSTATKQTYRLDTLQQLIQVNLAALDFALQPDIAENQTPSSNSILADPSSNLPIEEKTLIEQSVSALAGEWQDLASQSDFQLGALGKLTNQIARLKDQMDQHQNPRTIKPEILTGLSAKMIELERNLDLLHAATLDCQNRTLDFLSGNPRLSKGATYLQSNTPGIK